MPSATNRQPLALAKMSPWLPKATVAIEDARFWQHGALDYQGIARALFEDLTSGQIVQGGSTLTQQLVRNLYIGDPQKTISRKIKEACLADKLFSRMQRGTGTTRRSRSRGVSQRGVLRPPRVRRRGRGADVLLEERVGAQPQPGGAPRRSAAGADDVRPARQSPTSRSQRRNEVSRAMRKNGYITRAAVPDSARANGSGSGRDTSTRGSSSRTSSAGRRSSSPPGTASGRSSAAG